MVDVEQKVRYLMRAARRAEREGNLRMAGLFRSKADELRPSAIVDLITSQSL